MELFLMDSQTLLVSLLAVAGSVFFLDKLLTPNPEAKEPPFVSSSVPIIGHSMGIFWYKMKYFTFLSNKYKHKIFTLPMFGGRLYIVTSPKLANSIQKHYKAFSFWFIEATFSIKLGSLNSKTAALLLHNAAGREEGSSMMMDGLKGTHAAMISGLNRMNQTVLTFLNNSLNQVAKKELETEVDLWKWVENNITLATSTAIYGSKNPYLNPEVADGLRIMTPKGYAGRERVVTAFREYFRTNSFDSGSDLIKSRVRSLKNYGICDEDIARLETVHGFGVLVNTLPTAFWSVYHVFSDPETLSLVRKLIEPLVSASSSPAGTPIRILDASKLGDIPALVSIVDESIRFHSNGAGARLVMEDFVLDDQYLLKKDSFLMMPNREVHFDADAWEEDAERFNASRFVTQGNKKKPNTAFRGFGSGVNACPGKNFARSSILSMIAMLVLRFEITPIEGKWTNPGDDGSNMSLVICPPKKKVGVNFRPREGWGNEEWTFTE